MTRWPIQRTWIVSGASGGIEKISTDQLISSPACCLLGAAGLGKTSEAKYLAESEVRLGANVRYEQLAMLATSADRLETRLVDRLKDLHNGSVLFLDGLDEAMLQVRTCGRILAAWIREELQDRHIKVRFTCRSAVWPHEVSTALSLFDALIQATAYEWKKTRCIRSNGLNVPSREERCRMPAPESLSRFTEFPC